MKLKIKINPTHPVCIPQVIDKGDWVDLHISKNVKLKGILNAQEINVQYLPLGIAMQLPKGFEAIVAPRSSAPKKLGIVCANSIGVIDWSYNSDSDEWCFPAIAIRDTEIKFGTRICQFRIQLSQKATFWQKLKWLLSSGIKFEVVDTLHNESRGGLGSTGL